MTGDDFGASALRLAGSCAVVFGWSPDRFWRSTPAEVATLVAALLPPGAVPPGRDVIDRLMEAFPDG